MADFTADDAAELAALMGNATGFSEDDANELAALEADLATPDAPTLGDFSSTEKSTLGLPDKERVISPEERVNVEKHRVSSALGGAVDFNTSDISSVQRFDLGLSTNIDEARLKIRNYTGFSKANVEQVGNDIYVQKEGKSGLWRPVDTVSLSQGDLAEVASRYGPQIAGSLASVGTGPVGLFATLAKAFLGGAVGFGAGQAVEEARGTQTDPIKDVLLQSARAGTEEAFGQGFGEVVGRLLSGATGRGIVRLDKDQQEVVMALRDAGATPTPGAIARSPIAKQTEDFYSRLSTSASKSLKANTEKISQFRTVLKNRLGTPESLEAGRLLRDVHGPRIIKNLKESYRSAVKEFFGTGKTKGLRATGRGIKEGLESFRTRIAGIKDGLYASVKAQANELGEDMAVDVTNMQRSLAALSDSIVAKVVGGKAGKRTLAQTLTGKQPATKQSVKDIALKPGDKDLVDVMGTLSVLEKEQPFEVIDQMIKNINAIGRKESLSPNDGRIVGKLRDMLDNSLTNDILVTNPELKSMYQRARRFAKGRAIRLENDFIRHISKTWKPAKLVQELTKPGQLDTMLVARKSMPKAKWTEVKNQVRQDLLDNPDKILKNMEKYHQDEKKILFNAGEERALIRYGENIRDLNNSPLQQVIDSRLDSGKVVFKELLGDNSDRATQLLGQMDKKALDELRPGIIAEILDRSTKIANGKVVPDIEKFGKVMLNLEKREIGNKILRASDRKLLNKWVAAAGSQPRLSGAGGLASISLISSALSFKDGAIGKLLYTGIMGHLITSKGTSKLLFGSGKAQPINQIANLVRITNTLKKGLTESNFGDASDNTVKDILDGRQ